ncbi:MAG: hypothetical protein Q7U80_18040, partial [Thiobacillus sp.]|nr:hypothetical protein [Thiobacillus sp.]
CMKKNLPKFLQQSLGREIALVIAIKLLVIVAIFYAFFDGRAVDPDADSVADRLVNSQQHPSP